MLDYPLEDVERVLTSNSTGPKSRPIPYLKILKLIFQFNTEFSDSAVAELVEKVDAAAAPSKLVDGDNAGAADATAGMDVAPPRDVCVEAGPLTFKDAKGTVTVVPSRKKNVSASFCQQTVVEYQGVLKKMLKTAVAGLRETAQVKATAGDVVGGAEAQATAGAEAPTKQPLRAVISVTSELMNTVTTTFRSTSAHTPPRTPTRARTPHTHIHTHTNTQSPANRCTYATP